jgi:hypothetical protein
MTDCDMATSVFLVAGLPSHQSFWLSFSVAVEGGSGVESHRVQSQYFYHLHKEISTNMPPFYLELHHWVQSQYYLSNLVNYAFFL